MAGRGEIVTKVTMNPENLETAIKSLRDLADDCVTAREDVAGYYDAGGDTLASRGYREPEDFRTAANAAIATLRSRASELGTCKDNIVALNESGIAAMDADGVVTVDVPDDVELTSADAVSRWAGSKDAADLVDALDEGHLPDRSYDEIIASMRRRCHDPLYASGVIDAIGTGNLTSLPLEMTESYSRELCADPDNAPTELASLLGTVLATASTPRASWPGWTREQCQQAARAITESVDDPEECANLTVLNTMLGGHDTDGDRMSDLTVNRYLLIELADCLDDLDTDQVKEAQGAAMAGRHISGASFDPMAGVLEAMGANPYAALGYLAPAAADGSVDTSRVDALCERHWVDDQGLAGYTAALAAGSSVRATSVTGQSQRATQLAGHAIHGLAHSTGEDDYNDTTKARIGVLLANCSHELTNAWTSGDEVLKDIDTGEVLPVASVSDVNKLTYRVADNVDAMATVAASLGDYSRSMSKAGVAAHEGDPGKQINAINISYNRGGQAMGFLTGMADVKAGEVNQKLDEDAEARSTQAKTAVGVFGAVATAGLSAVGGPVEAAVGSKAGGAVASALTTLTTPVAADALDGSDPHHVAPAMPSDPTNGLWAAEIQDAANAGLLDQRDFTVPGSSDYPWIVHKSDGTYDIDLNRLLDSNTGEVGSWTNTVNHPTRDGDQAIRDLRNDFNGDYASGRGTGSGAALALKK